MKQPEEKETKPEELVFVEVKGEKSRTYIFSETAYTIHNVVKLCVRPSGNHRLEDKDGKKYIIKADWLAIEIDAEQWDF